ncbi:DUF4097 family beta strand repeat-containing protein [Streptomyces sp. NPDC058953]|uniref:DUF4097 family beta strand repeat-containing protein n=1 Tax=unclassified Streptomyces TaxID=2593676 RepID=UPI0036BDDDA6
MRRRQLRRPGMVAVAGLVVALVAGASGCGLNGDSFDDNSALSGKITSVLLDDTGADVTVKGTSGTRSLTLERRVEYRDDRPKKPTHRIENGVLVLGGCGRDCSVEYEVEVPEGTPVRGEMSKGTVKLSRVGAVKVTTKSGRIEMNGVKGAVEVKTSKGRITGRNIQGNRITAAAGDGTVHLTVRTPASVTATTDGGRISLRVPKARYQVAVASDGGDKNVDIAHDPRGRHKITLKTKDGDITLRDS